VCKISKDQIHPNWRSNFLNCLRSSSSLHLVTLQTHMSNVRSSEKIVPCFPLITIQHHFAINLWFNWPEVDCFCRISSIYAGCLEIKMSLIMQKRSSIIGTNLKKKKLNAIGYRIRKRRKREDCWFWRKIESKLTLMMNLKFCNV
jgi:hypothetical protein